MQIWLPLWESFQRERVSLVPDPPGPSQPLCGIPDGGDRRSQGQAMSVLPVSLCHLSPSVLPSRGGFQTSRDVFHCFHGGGRPRISVPALTRRLSLAMIGKQKAHSGFTEINISK